MPEQCLGIQMCRGPLQNRTNPTFSIFETQDATVESVQTRKAEIQTPKVEVQTPKV